MHIEGEDIFKCFSCIRNIMEYHPELYMKILDRLLAILQSPTYDPDISEFPSYEKDLILL